MPSRYYFLSSLPMLRFSGGAPFSWEGFLAQAKGNVSAGDYRNLCAIASGEDNGNPFLKRWAVRNAKLDDAVNSMRRARLGKASDGSPAFRELEVEQVASSAMNAKTPLEAELILMKHRFDGLESEKGFEPFSEVSLLCYALQLRILIRKDLFNRKDGNAQYDRLFGILQKEMKMD